MQFIGGLEVIIAGPYTSSAEVQTPSFHGAPQLTHAIIPAFKLATSQRPRHGAFSVAIPGRGVWKCTVWCSSQRLVPLHRVLISSSRQRDLVPLFLYNCANLPSELLHSFFVVGTPGEMTLLLDRRPDCSTAYWR